MEVYSLSYSYFSETGQNKPDWFARPKWAWKWLQTRNMPLIRLVKDSISFPSTPRTSNLDLKWRSYGCLKLTKINCPENKNWEKRPKTRVMFACKFENEKDFKWKNTKNKNCSILS